jgi:hypothetical protein
LSSFGWLEWYFAFFAAAAAGCFVHFSGATEASAAATVFSKVVHVRITYCCFFLFDENRENSVFSWYSETAPVYKRTLF